MKTKKFIRLSWLSVVMFLILTAVPVRTGSFKAFQKVSKVCRKKFIFMLYPRRPKAALRSYNLPQLG
jgi:hypothetical protein